MTTAAVTVFDLQKFVDADESIYYRSRPTDDYLLQQQQHIISLFLKDGYSVFHSKVVEVKVLQIDGIARYAVVYESTGGNTTWHLCQSSDDIQLTSEEQEILLPVFYANVQRALTEDAERESEWETSTQHMRFPGRRATYLNLTTAQSICEQIQYGLVADGADKYSLWCEINCNPDLVIYEESLRSLSERLLTPMIVY